MGLTQRKAAEKYGVSLHTYRMWETDQEKGPKPLKPLKQLKDHERCFIARRRAGETIETTAATLGVCRYWVYCMEKGDAPVDRLLTHWSM